MKAVAMMFQRDPNPVLGGNSINTDNTINITIAADNDAGTAPKSQVYLFRGAGDLSRAELPDGVTISGDYDDWADFQDYVSRIPMSIKAIELQTDNTNNYKERIYYGNMTPSRKNEITPYFELTKFRQNTGNGYADDLHIFITDPAKYLTNIAQFFMLFTLLKNSELQITLTVDKVNQTPLLTDINF